MTEQHVPVERLAAYAAGDLDASAALEVEAHVLLCADCRADVAAVQRVTAELAAAEQLTMPADVAARLDATLAREQSVPVAAGAGTAPAGDVLPMERRRRMPSFAAMSAVAAGVALVAAITVPLASRGGGSDGSGEGGANDTAASAPMAGLESAKSIRRVESGLDYAPDNVELVLRLALSEDGAPSIFTREDGAAPAEGSTGAGAEGSTPTAYAQRDAAGLALQTDAGRLAACIDSLADAQPEVGRTPLLVDFATFRGQPAVIVVFPTVSRDRIRPDKVDFWAVGPGCGTARGDDDARHFARIDRPPGL